MERRPDPGSCDHPEALANRQVSKGGAGLSALGKWRAQYGATCTQRAGSTDDGIYIYARYRWGCLSIGSGRTIAEAVRSSDNLLQKQLGDNRDGSLEYASILTAYHFRAFDSAKGETLTFHEMAKVSGQNRSQHPTYRRHEVLLRLPRDTSKWFPRRPASEKYE